VQSGAFSWPISHRWDRRTSLAPNVPVTLTAADYLAGGDPALETVKAMIARISTAGASPVSARP